MSLFYDANSPSGINASIINVFSDIQKQLGRDAENIPGLIDGNQLRIELIEKIVKLQSWKRK